MQLLLFHKLLDLGYFNYSVLNTASKYALTQPIYHYSINQNVSLVCIKHSEYIKKHCKSYSKMRIEKYNLEYYLTACVCPSTGL